MKYGIDLDGVLADFGGEVVRIGNQLWPGKFPPGYVPDNWNYEGYLTKAEWNQIWDVIKATPYFWEKLERLPGFEQLQRATHVYPNFLHDEIYFITARAVTVGESPMVQSFAWLNRGDLAPRFGYSTVIAVADGKDKASLFRSLGLHYMLDDYAPTVEALNRIYGEDGKPLVKAYVLDQPWNRYATELPRVYSVMEYLKAIHEQNA